MELGAWSYIRAWTKRVKELPAAGWLLPAEQSFANSVTAKNRLVNLLQFVEPTSFFYLARMRWSSHLVPIANANLGPSVQILNIIKGHFPMSSSFYKDFNKQRGVVAGRQILLNNPEHLKGKKP